MASRRCRNRTRGVTVAHRSGGFTRATPPATSKRFHSPLVPVGTYALAVATRRARRLASPRETGMAGESDGLMRLHARARAGLSCCVSTSPGISRGHSGIRPVGDAILVATPPPSTAASPNPSFKSNPAHRRSSLSGPHTHARARLAGRRTFVRRQRRSVRCSFGRIWRLTWSFGLDHRKDPGELISAARAE